MQKIILEIYQRFQNGNMVFSIEDILVKKFKKLEQLLLFHNKLLEKISLRIDSPFCNPE